MSLLNQLQAIESACCGFDLDTLLVNIFTCEVRGHEVGVLEPLRPPLRGLYASGPSYALDQLNTNVFRG